MIRWPSIAVRDGAPTIPEEGTDSPAADGGVHTWLRACSGIPATTDCMASEPFQRLLAVSCGGSCVRVRVCACVRVCVHVCMHLRACVRACARIKVLTVLRLRHSSASWPRPRTPTSR